MNTTILQVSSESTREAAGNALRNAGIGVVETDNWEQAADVVRRGEACVVVCDGEALRSMATSGAALSREASRSLSHDLRTPLSAMVGWLHLLESGKLDEAGRKRALAKLRGNIEEQVRTIERHLGTNSPEGKRQ